MTTSPSKKLALDLNSGALSVAIAEIAAIRGVSSRTLWNWIAAVDGIRSDDRLPYLAPRHRAAKRGGPKAGCAPEFWEMLKADYLRPEQPSFTTCYRRARRVAAGRFEGRR